MNELIMSLAAQHVAPQKAILIVKQYYAIDWIQFGRIWNYAVNLIA